MKVNTFSECQQKVLHIVHCTYNVRNLLETRVIIKISIYPCYPINVDVHGDGAKKNKEKKFEKKIQNALAKN